MLNKLDRNKLNMLEILFEDLKQGVIICDKNGKIVLYNKAYGELDNMSPDFVLDKTIEKCYSMGRDESMLRLVMKTKKPVLIHRQQYVTKSGHFVDAVKDTYPIIDGSEVIGAFAIVRDFSNAKSWVNNIVREILVDSTKDIYEDIIDFSNLKSLNKKMQLNVIKINKVLKKFSNLAIFGEQGSENKEIARYIASKYAQSKRLISFNCAAFNCENEGLALFGDDENHLNGVLNSLGGEILILENVDTLTLENQFKLQKHIQEHQIKIITIFNKTPKDIFSERKLSLELFYILNDTSLSIPNLSEHKEDLSFYITCISSFYANKENKNAYLSLAAYRSLMAHDWRGNYIELVNVIKASIELSENGEIDVFHLPDYILEDNNKDTTTSTNTNVVYSHLNDVLLHTEKVVVRAAMDKHNNNISKACIDLGISRQNLQYRLKKLNL